MNISLKSGSKKESKVSGTSKKQDTAKSNSGVKIVSKKKSALESAKASMSKQSEVESEEVSEA